MENPIRQTARSALKIAHMEVCAEQPFFADIDMIACQRELCLPWLSSTRCTARSRTSGEYLFVVLLIVASSYSGVEASGKPGAVHIDSLSQADSVTDILFTFGNWGPNETATLDITID